MQWVLREAEADSQGETGGQDSNWPQNNDDDDDVTPGRNLAGTWQLFLYKRKDLWYDLAGFVSPTAIYILRNIIDAVNSSLDPQL